MSEVCPTINYTPEGEVFTKQHSAHKAAMTAKTTKITTHKDDKNVIDGKRRQPRWCLDSACTRHLGSSSRLGSRMRNVKRHRTEICGVNNSISHSNRVGDVVTGRLKFV